MPPLNSPASQRSDMKAASQLAADPNSNDPAGQHRIKSNLSLRKQQRTSAARKAADAAQSPTATGFLTPPGRATLGRGVFLPHRGEIAFLGKHSADLRARLPGMPPHPMLSLFAQTGGSL
jgi:hypothetical protein